MTQDNYIYNDGVLENAEYFNRTIKTAIRDYQINRKLPRDSHINFPDLNATPLLPVPKQ